MKCVISNILIFCGLLFWPLMSYSQRSISGNILDENNEGIADATSLLRILKWVLVPTRMVVFL